MRRLACLCAALAAASQLMAGAASGEEFRGKWWHYYQRGMEFSESAKLEEALSDLKTALRMRDKDQRMARTYGMHFIDYFPHRELGIALLKRGDREGAIRELEESLRLADSAKGVFYLNAARKANLSASPKGAAAPLTVSLEMGKEPLVTRANAITVKATVTSAAFVSKVTVNGASYPVEQARTSVAVSQLVTLDEDPKEIRIVAEDLAGSTAQAALPLVIKREGPSVSAGVSYRRDAGRNWARVTGEVYDGLGIRSVQVGDRQLAPNGAHAFPLDLSLERNGAERVLVRAVDAIGNETVAVLDLSEVMAQEGAARAGEERESRERQAAEGERQARLAAEQEREARLTADREEARLKGEAERAASELAAKQRLAQEAEEKARLEALAAEGARQAAEEAGRLARLAARQAEEEQAARLKAEAADRARLALEKERAEGLAREAQQREALAREENLARLKAEADRMERLAAAQKAREEQAAREDAERRRVAAQQAERERLAREAAEGERLARERQAQELVARLKAEGEERASLAAAQKAKEDAAARAESERSRIAAEGAERERLAREAAERERQAQEQREQRARARLKAEGEERARLAAEKARADLAARAESERSRIAAEGAERERLALETAARERLAQEQKEQERIALLQAEAAEKVRHAAARSEAERSAREEAERARRAALAAAKADSERQARAEAARQQASHPPILVEREKLKAIANEQKLSLALSSDTDKQLEPGRMLTGEGTSVYRPPAAGSRSAAGNPAAVPGPLPGASAGCQGPDREKPVLEINDSGVPFVFVDAYPLDGRATDNCQVARVVVNGREVPIRKGKQVYFSSIVKLRSGENSVQVDAYDAAGNRASSQLQVVRKIPSVLQNGSRMSLLVLPFDYDAAPGAALRLASDYLAGSLSEQHRFLVVERQKLKALMAERKVMMALGEDNEKAAQFGKLAAAEAIVVNSARQGENSFEVTSRIVDTETSEVLSVLDAYTEDTSAGSIKNLMTALAAKIARNFPVVEGVVISRDDERVVTDLAAPQMVRQRAGAIIYRRGKEIKHPVTGKSLGFDTEKLGEGYLDEVQENFSKLKLGERYRDKVIQANDLVVTK